MSDLQTPFNDDVQKAACRLYGKCAETPRGYLFSREQLDMAERHLNLISGLREEYYRLNQRLSDVAQKEFDARKEISKLKREIEQLKNPVIIKEPDESGLRAMMEQFI